MCDKQDVGLNKISKPGRAAPHLYVVVATILEVEVGASLGPEGG